jgi:SAM-dependent methyltransferase
MKAYIDQLKDKDTAILIPGCGNAYEAEYLLQQGFPNVTVIDISSEPTDALREKLHSYVEAGKLKIVCGDFFLHEGQYDLILEQTFFCALNPSLRSNYAMHCYSLLKTGGKVKGVMFDRSFGDEGPPWGGSAEEYRGYFSPIFNDVKIEPCYNSIAPRAGTEVFIGLSK